MNLNQQIKPFTADGIPEYNRKFNEVIAAINYLMKMRTVNGRPVRDSDQGPVIDLSAANMTQGGGAWLTDPDGNTAGWSLITCLNLQTNQAFDVWIWTGQTPKNVRNIPWMFDPSNNPASWIVCTDNTLWGTGHCGGSPSANFQYATNVILPQYPNLGTSPNTQTSNPRTPPIIPPRNPPVIYLQTTQWVPDPGIGAPVNPPSPFFTVGNGLTSIQGSIGFNWSFTITYDGTEIFTDSGSATAVYNQSTYIYLNQAGWEFDPGGLDGYSQGNKRWIYLYNGPISPSTNPTVVQTFTFSAAPLGMNFCPVVYLTG